MNKRQATKLVNELNQIIHCRNLYWNGRHRLVHAQMEKTQPGVNGWRVTLLDLYPNKRVPWDMIKGDQLTDGNGNEVNL